MGVVAGGKVVLADATAAEIVEAAVVHEIALELALEVELLAQGLGDHAAPVLEVEPAGGAAVAEVVEAVAGVELVGARLSERFEQAPLGLDAGAERCRVLEADAAQDRAAVGHRAAGVRKVENGSIEEAEGRTDGAERRPSAEPRV